MSVSLKLSLLNFAVEGVLGVTASLLVVRIAARGEHWWY